MIQINVLNEQIQQIKGSNKQIEQGTTKCDAAYDTIMSIKPQLK
jgi:hypothetical protein